MVGFCQLTDSHHCHHGQKPTMVGICHGGNMPVGHHHHHHHHHHRHKYYLVCGVQTFSKWKFWFNFKEAQIGAWCRRKYEFCVISKFKWLWAFTISQKNTITQEWHWVGSSQNYIWCKIRQHWEVEAYDKRKNWQLMTLFFNFPKVQ